ncbi:MAG: HAD-IA family hydrolase [bacterium]
MATRHTRYQAVILRDDRALLLLRCVFRDGRDWWMLPGGGREQESEEECIVREVREETNLEVVVERLLTDQPAEPSDGMYVRWRTYLCRIVSGTAAPGGGEGADATLVDIMWLPLFDECAWPTDILRDEYLPHQLRAFRAALAPPVAAVLFDLDDTLLDRRASVDCYLAAHSQRFGLSGARADTYRARFHDLDGAGYTLRTAVFDQLSAEFPECGSGADLTSDWHERAFGTCVYVSGAADILAWCRDAGLRTAIVTNGRAVMQRPKLERLGVIELVDAVIVSGEEGIAKPDVEIFRRAAERLGVSPEECAFVGDNPHTDVAGAQAVGMHAIWVKRELEWPIGSSRPAHSIVELGALRHVLRAKGSRAP